MEEERFSWKMEIRERTRTRSILVKHDLLFVHKNTYQYAIHMYLSNNFALKSSIFSLLRRLRTHQRFLTEKRLFQFLVSSVIEGPPGRFDNACMPQLESKGHSPITRPAVRGQWLSVD